jgi:cysteine desulfurase
MIYLDNSSTTRQYDEVTDLIAGVSRDTFGNASSLHSMGLDASNILVEARSNLAKCFPKGGDVIFTSGGTESDNFAIFSSARKLRRWGNRIITTSVEHPAVLEACKRLAEDGFDVVHIGTDDKGCVDIDEFKEALDDKTILVTMMSVNNETGTIEPVLPCCKAVSEFNKKNGTNILFHTDAVQAFGKVAFNDAPFDLISISGHKFHGPKGTGALYIKNKTNIPAFIVGGGHEKGLRSGTENVPGFAGLGLAAKMSCADLDVKMRNMAEVNEYLRTGLIESIGDIRINGPEELGYGLSDYGKRCPSVLNVTFSGTRGEVILHTLEQDGIFVSTGSACSSNEASKDSHVLSSMGLNHKQIEGAIRFSLSEFNTKEEMDIVIDKTKTAVERFRKLGSFR